MLLFMQMQDGGERDGRFEERNEEDLEYLMDGDVEDLVGGIVCWDQLISAIALVYV